MYPRRRTFPALALLLLLAPLATALSGCDSTSAQREFEADAAMPPAGITPTDVDGNVIGEPDPDDWRTAPLFPSVTVQPAYPNPVPVGFAPPISIPVSIPFDGVIAGGLHLLIYDPRQPERFAVPVDHIPPGSLFEFVELRFTRAEAQSALQLADAAGLYRVFIQDGAGRLVSYGDIRME
jgi:hypothetical protein